MAAESKTASEKFVREIVWKNVAYHIMVHLFALYGLYLVFTSAKLFTTLFIFVLYLLSILGITAGVHRLWSHKSYEASFSLRLLLMILYTLSAQDSIWLWVRDHRVHHKFCETNADPHNINRGTFFAHIGWLLCRKHPDVKNKGQTIDLSDLETDPIVMFNKKYYYSFMTLVNIIIPTLIAVFVWNETWNNAIFVVVFLRHVMCWELSFLVNSAAHTMGHKPYDRFISSAENMFVSACTLGEGWHNYHHTFPWDYKALELPSYGFNWTTCFIDFCSKIGLAYNLKTVPAEIIKARCERTGDGTHEIWGWGDKDQTLDERQKAIITYKKK